MGWLGRDEGGNGGSAETAAPTGLVDAARELAAPLPLAAPRIEAQPWAKGVWRTLASTSVGVARLDLRRPDFLDVDGYDSRNLLYTRPGAIRRGPGRPRRDAGGGGGGLGGLAGGFLGAVLGGRRGGEAPAFVLDTGDGGGGRRRRDDGECDDEGRAYGAPAGRRDGGGAGGGGGGGGQAGARLKIMRCWQVRPEGNDLEGARRAEEAARRLGRAGGGGAGGWVWWPFRGGGGGGGGSSGNGDTAVGEPAPGRRSALGLELVPRTAATGAEALFGDAPANDEPSWQLRAQPPNDGNTTGSGGSNTGGGMSGISSSSSPQYSLRAPKPLLDFSLGAALNLDASRLEPIARVKVAGLVSLHLAGGRCGGGPRVKVGRVWRVPGTSMALRLRYECPLRSLNRPWEPPGRLLLRLDNGAGSGVHLSPGGLEVAERRISLGDNLALRAGATLLFPRPGERERGRAEDAGALRVRVHRLSVKSLW
jgi:hypothetical protein